MATKNKNTVGSKVIEKFDDWDFSPTKTHNNQVNKVIADGLIYVKDPFWNEKITEISQGIYPYGFRLSDMKFIYKKGGSSKKNTINIPDNPEIAVNTIINILKKEGIQSPEEKEAMNHKIEIVPTLVKWSDANSSLQTNLLCYYCTTKSKEMNLTNDEKSKLNILLDTGAENGIINDESVIMEHNRIANINVLKWNEENRSFYYTKVPPNKKSSKNSANKINETYGKNMKPKLSTKLNRYMKTVSKKLADHEKRNTGTIYSSKTGISINIPDTLNFDTENNTTITSGYYSTDDEDEDNEE